MGDKLARTLPPSPLCSSSTVSRWTAPTGFLMDQQTVLGTFWLIEGLMFGLGTSEVMCIHKGM